MIKNIILDIDGTLWNSTPVVAGGWQRAIDELGYSKAVVTAKVLQREFGQPMDVIADHVFSDVSDASKRQQLLELCCRYEHECLEANDKDISYDKIAETLKNLADRSGLGLVNKSERKYGLYIVSNCQKGYIELVMNKLKIVDIITDYLCFGDTGTSKGETMRRLMEKNNLKPEESVYVGDTAGDKKASCDAGVKFIYASYGFGNLNGEKYVVSAPEYLRNVIESIE